MSPTFWPFCRWMNNHRIVCGNFVNRLLIGTKYAYYEVIIMRPLAGCILLHQTNLLKISITLLLSKRTINSITSSFSEIKNIGIKVTHNSTSISNQKLLHAALEHFRWPHRSNRCLNPQKSQYLRANSPVHIVALLLHRDSCCSKMHRGSSQSPCNTWALCSILATIFSKLDCYINKSQCLDHSSQESNCSRYLDKKQNLLRTASNITTSNTTKLQYAPTSYCLTPVEIRPSTPLTISRWKCWNGEWHNQMVHPMPHYTKQTWRNSNHAISNKMRNKFHPHHIVHCSLRYKASCRPDT